MDLSEFWSVKETSCRTGFAVRTLNIWRYQGQGPAFVKIHGRVLYRPQDVAEWAEKFTPVRSTREAKKQGVK